MLYLATISFSGQVNMAKGKVGEIPDQAIADDLLKAGYIVPFESTEKVEAKPKRKGGKKNED